MKALVVVFVVIVFALPVLAQDGPPPPPELTGDIVAEGLNGPQGLAFDADGNLLIVDSGTGGEEVVESVNPTTFALEAATLGQTARVIRLNDAGEQEVIVTLPSIAVGEDALGGARAAVLDGAVYVTVGA